MTWQIIYKGRKKKTVTEKEGRRNREGRKKKTVTEALRGSPLRRRGL
jgi:hypothetical protein